MDANRPAAVITIDPAVRGGRPCIDGTGLRVSDIVIAQPFHQQSPDEIAAGFGVPLADVAAALAYYAEHRSAIDADIREQIATTNRLRAQWLASGGKPL